VRRNVVRLVELLADLPGIEELTMTTNGTLLSRYARALATAGLQRVNVSLDAIRPERYAELTGGGDVRDVLAGIAAAREAGLTPVKLNCVVEESSAEADARDVAAFAAREGCEARFIRRMVMETGHFAVVEGGSGGDCERCNRLRLTSDGRIMPCLFCDVAFGIRELGAEEAILRAVREKPEAGGPCTHGWMAGIGG
jgi:cyclic pyranopterin phosphate synthase